MCGYSLILVLSRFAACALNNLDCGSEAHFLIILFLFLESILFLMFTLCMLGDQLSSMRSNQTSIDKLKNQKHDIRIEVNEVCGSPLEVKFQMKWLMPVSVYFTEILREKIMGYRVSPSVGGEYCLSCPSKEEVTPLMDPDPKGAGVEMTMTESRIKESKSEDAVQGEVAAVPGARSSATSSENHKVRTGRHNNSSFEMKFPFQNSCCGFHWDKFVLFPYH